MIARLRCATVRIRVNVSPKGVEKSFEINGRGDLADNAELHQEERSHAVGGEMARNNRSMMTTTTAIDERR
ncbi:unnamed protein product [Lampetra planeri]